MAHRSRSKRTRRSKGSATRSWPGESSPSCPSRTARLTAAPQVTRGDLAALIGVRLGPLLQTMPMRDPSVITDVRTHWAENWIIAVARAGVMESYENHTFQPGSVGASHRSGAGAQPAAREGRVDAHCSRQWQSARVTVADLAPDHLAFPAASLAVASGVLTLDPDGRFQPSRIVTGQEAVEAIQQLAAIAGLADRR